jgi:DNA-binding transcriptional LysR family regulator
MKQDLADLYAFVTVARAGGFRQAARASEHSASGLSEAVRRLETQLGVRLLNRTTRSVTATEAGRNLLERLAPALSEVKTALDVVNRFRDSPVGTLRLNVPGSVARSVLPRILPGFLDANPDIAVDISVDESFIDIVASGFDAGIRYEERLEQDMIAVPIGPRSQSYALAAAPAYLDRSGRPQHPRDLLGHACLRHRFPSGNTPPWEFERDGEIVFVEPSGPLLVQAGGGIDLLIDVARKGGGIIAMFEDWLHPHFHSGSLEPVLKSWWQRFSGPFLYYSGRRLVPAPLRAFVDYIKLPANRW